MKNIIMLAALIFSLLFSGCEKGGNSGRSDYLNEVVYDNGTSVGLVSAELYDMGVADGVTNFEIILKVEVVPPLRGSDEGSEVIGTRTMITRDYIYLNFHTDASSVSGEYLFENAAPGRRFSDGCFHYTSDMAITGGKVRIDEFFAGKFEIDFDLRIAGKRLAGNYTGDINRSSVTPCTFSPDFKQCRLIKYAGQQEGIYRYGLSFSGAGTDFFGVMLLGQNQEFEAGNYAFGYEYSDGTLYGSSNSYVMTGGQRHRLISGHMYIEIDDSEPERMSSIMFIGKARHGVNIDIGFYGELIDDDY